MFFVQDFCLLNCMTVNFNVNICDKMTVNISDSI